MLNARPGLHPFNDLDDTDALKWLEGRGIAYDVATDHDLHNYGRARLGGHGTVMTLWQPEYTSARMWDALAGWQGAGVRHMYLGGSGFCWCIPR